jgi:hypothetical protein
MKFVLKGVGFVAKGFVMIILEVIKDIIVWILKKIIIFIILMFLARMILMGMY